MKILQINTRYIGGGGAAYIANMLHKNLNKLEDYESVFLYGRGINGDGKSHRIIYSKSDYLTALIYRVIGKEFNFNKNFEKYVSECDIVHLHNIHGYYISLKKLFGLIKKYNKPVVWTLHDMWPITGRCAYSFKCEKWKRNCGKCGYKNLYPKTMCDRSARELENKKSIIGSMDKDKLIIVTPSKWLANICKKSYLNKFRIYDIPNGIEYYEINKSKNDLRDEYKIDRNKKVVLFVAADSNDKRKGIKYILDIIPECKDYLFISIGRKIENISYNNFIQLGYINDRQKINEIYSLSDIFVIPSLEDNFPTTVLESFSNSTPVIGFNIGGIPEQITSDVGSIIKEISSYKLKKEIQLLLEDKKRLNMLSNNCSKKFLDEYTLDIFIDRYLNIYKQLYDECNIN